MADNLSDRVKSGAVRDSSAPCQVANYVYYGGVVGTAVSFAAAFGAAFYDGYVNRGLELCQCPAYAGFLTLMLSHPIGAAGVTLGFASGGLAYMGSRMRKSHRCQAACSHNDLSDRLK